MVDLRNRVLAELGGNLTAERLQMVDMAMSRALVGVRLEAEETLPEALSAGEPMEVREFLAKKKMKGCSEGTVNLYRIVLRDFCLWLRRDIKTAKDIDILMFLDYEKTAHGVSNSTLNSRRLILSSFFGFLADSGKIVGNPIRGVDTIKCKATVRKPLSDMELEMVRNACESLREKALFEVLYSTGARVSEVVSMNRTEIDRENRSMVITGKGNKERHIFFNAKAMLALKNYLSSRTDKNEALFVTEVSPYRRLSKASIEAEVKRIGNRSGIGRRVYPHLMRHTFATDALFHGARVEEVQKMLGHEKLDTTMIYAKTQTSTLQHSHRMYVS